MSWLYSQALVEEYLGDICLDGEQSVPLNGNLTQQAYCAPDKMTVFSRLFRFGMTYKPLTENLGEELLTLFRGAFPVRTLVPQEKEQALQETDRVCGNTWPGLLARYDLNSHSWKTVQCSLFEDLELSLETWPKWGLMQDGVCWEQTPLALPTNETESGFWLTPSTVDIPTRSKESMEKRFAYREKMGRHGVGAGCLSEQVEWSKDGPPIGYMTKTMWPTPKCSDSRHAISRHITDPEGRWIGNLGEVVYAMETFPTPMASDNRDRGNLSSPSVQRRLKIGKQVSLGQSVSQTSGRLNPQWVAWLMGWPVGWTSLKPWVMDKSHSVPQQHGIS